MREKIAESLFGTYQEDTVEILQKDAELLGDEIDLSGRKKWAEMPDKDSAFFYECADKAIALISEEIEKVDEYWETIPSNKCHESPSYYRGWEDACQKILSLLKE